MPTGQLLICKVLMLKSVKDTNQPLFDHFKSAKENFDQSPLKGEDYGPFSTVFRQKDQDSKHKMWFIFDNNIILPEYMIEFNY